jgi:hypothetical protein
MLKPIDKLTAIDFENHAVWRFTNSDEPDETYVKRVRRFPIKESRGCVFGTTVILSSGKEVVAMIGNLRARDSLMNEHFLGVSIFRDDGKLFHLARYHDYDYARSGPKALAKFLRMPIEHVFPFSFTIPRTILGTRSHFHSTIESEPKNKLTRSERIALILK